MARSWHKNATKLQVIHLMKSIWSETGEWGAINVELVGREGAGTE